ncbi:hypothetical protein [Pseudomonas sp. SMV7]|uniref:hypothetical protein n=1 Tax=Pseudomonas sp. SMV7 TaxID=3390194 RepID=UPI003F835A31
MAPTTTQVADAPGSRMPAPALLNMAELEKISCSTRGASTIHPLQLVGKSIRFAELQPVYSESFDDPIYQAAISQSVVLAVCLGSPKHGIETSLLLSGGRGLIRTTQTFPI